MPALQQYQHKYKNIAFERRDGILLMRLHTRNGPLQWAARDGTSVHAALGDAFYDVGHDADNRVVIMTGTGDEFLTALDAQEPIETFDADTWARIHREGRDLLMNLLDIEVPIIAAVNGPVLGHAELPMMSDIVLASEHTVVADQFHFYTGIVPGDGSQVWWQMALGPNRGRAFLLTGEPIASNEAKALGLVKEVLPRTELLPRAWHLAQDLLKKPQLVLRFTRLTLTHHLKKRMLEELGYGLGIEGLAMLSSASQR